MKPHQIEAGRWLFAALRAVGSGNDAEALKCICRAFGALEDVRLRDPRTAVSASPVVEFVRPVHTGGA